MNFFYGLNRFLSVPKKKKKGEGSVKNYKNIYYLK